MSGSGITDGEAKLRRHILARVTHLKAAEGRLLCIFGLSNYYILQSILIRVTFIRKSTTVNMPIVHIVLFEFKPTITREVVTDVCTSSRQRLGSTDSKQTCRRMLALKDKCIHPSTQKPYVKSYGGGRDTSEEGLQVVHDPS